MTTPVTTPVTNPNKLYLPDDTKKALEGYFDNPEIFKIFQDVPPMDENEIHEKAEKVRAQKAAEEKLTFKKLEKERKTAALAELERLGIKTDENVAMINAIKFEEKKYLSEIRHGHMKICNEGNELFKKKPRDDIMILNKEKQKQKNKK